MSLFARKYLQGNGGAGKSLNIPAKVVTLLARQGVIVAAIRDDMLEDNCGAGYKELRPVTLLSNMTTKLIIIGTLLLSCTASQYQKQLSVLPEAKREHYKILKYSIAAVGDRTEIAEFDSIPANDSIQIERFEENFWKKRDPNPFTPENEMKAEFDRRLGHVLQNFKSRQFYRPWDERGDVYLRFGEPTDRRTSVGMKFKISNLGVGGKIRNPPPGSVEEVSKEVWSYYNLSSLGKPLTFTFQEELTRGFVCIPNELSAKSLQEQLITWVSKIQQEPMQYFYDYGKGELQYAFGLTPFLIRESPNVYDIYLTINAPAKKLVTPTLDSIHYRWKVLVQDEDYERLFTDSTEGLSYLGSGADLDKLVALDQKELRLKAGTYIITSELVNSAGNKGGMLQSKLILPPYKFPKEIEVSKAILAKEVRVADSTDFKFVRNGLVIKPWVTSIFDPAQPFWLYFEIYNMPLDRERQSHFTLTYYLQDLLTDKKYEILEKDLRQGQRDYAIVQSFSDSLFQAAKVPVKTGKDYVLLTEIKDQVMGKKVQSLSAMFKFKKTG